jgi:alcohol dehydrogenase
MVAMVHALGHSVGSICHVPHGTCMAILLPYGLEYNLHKVEDRIAHLLLPLAGPDVFARTPEKDRASAAIEWIRAFNRKLNQATDKKHPTCLKDIIGQDGSPRVLRSDLPRIARTALGDGAVFYNPEDLDYQDLLMVAEAAWEGIPLDLSKIKKG